MNNTKRVLSVLLAALMLASVAAAIAIADGSNHTIVINYVFQDGKQAAPQWSASLGDGQSFSRTVESPSVVGYKPNQEKVEINESSVTKDITINVIYSPALVNFTVNHYLQNVDNDSYTLEKAESKQGYTESVVGDKLAETYDGFIALLYETDKKIAADGSTTVEIYYDRNYYLMKFELDGGYGVEPIYAKYGATIGDVGTPSKVNATFKGWSPSNLPETMPDKNTTYTALWEENPTANVTVVVWGENADDEEYSYMKTFVASAEVGKDFTVPADGNIPCAQKEHTHSDACYGNVCGKEEHTHKEGTCYTLTCGKTEHTHSEIGGSCYTANCGYDEHLHSIACYIGANKDKTGSPGIQSGIIRPQQGYVARAAFTSSDKVIYIDGKWYEYTGSVEVGEIATPDCGKEIHEHTDDCYILSCTQEVHTHSNDCKNITCTKEEHTHTGSCTALTCGETEHTHSNACQKGLNVDSNLWTFKESETKTVASDGSTIVNVYYERVEKTLTFNYNYNNRKYNSTDTITKKWGASISTEYNAIVEKAGSTFWSDDEDYSGPYTNYFGVMPQTSATYYYKQDNGSEGTMYYYGESLEGEYVEMFKVDNVGGYTVTTEDRYEFTGFTYDHGTSTGQSCKGAKFYYKRNSYTLSYYNYNSPLDDEYSIKYEAKVASDPYNITPNYPAGLEPNAYKFAGWYTSEECVPGTEVKWDEMTMPANDVILYAKWAPVVHTVTTKLTADAESIIGTIENVPHGSTVDTEENAIKTPERGQYTFVGWFYVDEDGTEKAFDPENMTVNRDLDLYAKWSTNVLVPYTISYELEDGTKIADDLKNSALGGTSKTFEAKVGTELYTDYQEGYFPKVSSHNFVMSVEEGADNTYTFVYVAKDKVPYTVRYLEKDTEKVLAPEKNTETRHAVVDELYVYVQGYVPDAAQKRLIVTANEDGNVITFWYTKDDAHAPVTIIHWKQNIEGNEYSEHSRTSYNDDIDTTIDAKLLSIDGFEYVKASATDGAGSNEVTVTETKEDGNVTKVSAELTDKGLIINLYYDRIEYPYEFKFVSALDGTTLAESETGTARYGAQVNHTADERIDNKYKFTETVTVNNTVINQTLSQSMTIQTDASKNVITFYYYPYFTVEHVQDGVLNTSAKQEVLITQNDFTYSLTNQVPSGYLYGGTFSDEACNTVYPFAQGESGLLFTPAYGATYYIWEPNENYLKPKAYSIWRNNDPAADGKTNIIEVYLASTVDRKLYQAVGFTMNGENHLSALGQDTGTTVYSKVRAAYTDGKVKEDLYVGTNGSLALQAYGLSDNAQLNHFVSMVKVNNHTQYNSEVNAIKYQPYWITLDGVMVTGTTERTCYYQGAGYQELKIVSDTKGGSYCTLGSNTQQTAVLANATAELRAIADGEDAPVVEETPAVEETPTEPETYEVPEMTYAGEAQYLRVQYTANTMLNTATLISAVDMSEFSEAGFIINGKKYVCTAFSTTVEGYDANYLFGSTVEGATLMSCNVALDGFTNGETLHITPYWVNNSGVTVYGETRTVVYYSWCGFEG